MTGFRYSLFLSDLALVAAYSLIGIAFHSIQGTLWDEFWRISLPFLIGYLTAGWAAQAYDMCESGKEFARRALWGLSVGLVCSFFLRGMQTGEWPSLPFLLPSVMFFCLWVAVFRWGYWKLLGAPSSTSRQSLGQERV